MSDIEFRQRLAKLQTLISINKVKVLSNPEPYLNDLSDQVGKLLKVIEDIDYALSSDCACDWAMSHNPPINIVDLQGESLIRCDAALKVIHEFRYPSTG